jgi:histidinol phosphatase-like enzyme (inositol monophosphatase family)
MSKPDYTDDLKLASRMADAARAAIRPYFRTALDVENKYDVGFDPVTLADRASEQAMREILDRERPDDGILGEEFGVKDGRNQRQWVLDPIDGTRAFICGLPTWAVLIALSDGEGPVVGVIDQPFTQERFVGEPGRSVLLQDGRSRVLKTRDRLRLSDAIMSSTDPALFSTPELAVFETLRDATRLCRYGYDAYAYAMLAMGGMDLVVETDLQPYDVQALIPVVEGAGGVITNWSGGPAWGGGQVIAAANAHLHAAALPILKSAARA